MYRYGDSVMSVALLYPYRDGKRLRFRGDVGAGGVSVFFPYREGKRLFLRGHNAAGEVLYGYTYRDPDTGRLMGRTLAGGEEGVVCGSCTYPNHPTVNLTVTGSTCANWPECDIDALNDSFVMGDWVYFGGYCYCSAGIAGPEIPPHPADHECTFPEPCICRRGVQLLSPSAFYDYWRIQVTFNQEYSGSACGTGGYSSLLFKSGTADICDSPVGLTYTVVSAEGQLTGGTVSVS